MQKVAENYQCNEDNPSSQSQVHMNTKHLKQQQKCPSLGKKEIRKQMEFLRAEI